MSAYTIITFQSFQLSRHGHDNGRRRDPRVAALVQTVRRTVVLARLLEGVHVRHAVELDGTRPCRLTNEGCLRVNEGKINEFKQCTRLVTDKC